MLVSGASGDLYDIQADALFFMNKSLHDMMDDTMAIDVCCNMTYFSDLPSINMEWNRFSDSIQKVPSRLFPPNIHTYLVQHHGTIAIWINVLSLFPQSFKHTVTCTPSLYNGRLKCNNWKFVYSMSNACNAHSTIHLKTTIAQLCAFLMFFVDVSVNGLFNK